ncbi:MAG: flagellar FliJ family protein, partial [Gemmatimonadaceae bacterium]|nr:flagellar FliJ family protein [Gemmatimonadaceae bacterium]
AATELERARAEEDAARERRQQLDAERQAAEQRRFALPGAPVAIGSLRQAAFVSQQMSVRVIAADELLASAAREVQGKETDFRTAYRDRRVLDRLRDRRFDEWRLAEQLDERVRMDEIARDRHKDALNPAHSDD